MNRRRDSAVLDLAGWVEFDSGALPIKQRKVFLARRRAIELYAQRTAIGQIEDETGVDRRQLYRLLDRCMESFVRMVEIVLKDSQLRDAPGYRPDPALWNVAVRSCGYIQSRQAVGAQLRATPA